jgi:Xaa-Pro dipeptidase
MKAAGLDGLVLFQPEHVAYAIGVNPGVAGLFRRAGAASALIPADPESQLAAVMPDLMEGACRAVGAVDLAFHPIWVDRTRIDPQRAGEPIGALFGGDAVVRPSTFDAAVAFSLLAEQLSARGLERARLGLDLAFVPAADLVRIRQALPHADIADGTDAIRRLRMVKTSADIERLRLAVELSEAGLVAALDMIRPGIDRRELGTVYDAAVGDAATRRGVQPGSVWDYISIGPDPWGAGRPAQMGDILKFDVGVVMDGYSSDMARTVVLGQPPRAARELHAALLTALEAGLALLGPGVPLGDVHATMLNTVQARGVTGYRRGHFGHGLGNDPFSEQWPFIAADSDVVAEPGMVLAVEAPYYVDGLGGFIIEDQILVTPGGIELMSTLPRDFRSYG